MPQGQAGANSGHTKKREEFKVVIVGDGGCGKTSLITVYTKGDFPEKYVPSVFENVIASVRYRGTEFSLHLYDTSGRDDYDRLRPLSYQNVNLVLICYDVTCPSSFDNVLIKWYPEVHHFCSGVPIILVGCKSDLRKDKALGEETKRKINAELYLESSAKNRENVEDIFREATKRALAATRTEERTKRTTRQFCALL